MKRLFILLIGLYALVTSLGCGKQEMDLHHGYRLVEKKDVRGAFDVYVDEVLIGSIHTNFDYIGVYIGGQWPLPHGDLEIPREGSKERAPRAALYLPSQDELSGFEFHAVTGNRLSNVEPENTERKGSAFHSFVTYADKP